MLSFYPLHVVMGAPYLILLSLSLYLWFSRSKKICPPGPKGYPVIGNLLDFPGLIDLVSRVQTWRKVSSCLNYDHCTSNHM